MILYPLFFPAPAGADASFGGHLKYFYNLADFPERSVFAGDMNPYREQLGNLRLKFSANEGHWSTDVQYVMDGLYSKGLANCRIRGALASDGCQRLGSDAEQLFDMATVLSETDNTLLTQRIDRLWLAWSDEKLVVRAGRQAISWGNSMVYNTLDLFNPFAPDAIDTEYKHGQDMMYLQGLFSSGSDLQLLVIPRRDIDTGNLDADVSSAAAKMHWFSNQGEFDLLAASHYSDTVIGAAWTTDLGGNIVNTNLTVTRTDQDTVLSAVADYSFTSVVKGHNLTGFIEFFYNGFGLAGKRHSIADVNAQADLYDRLQRGELFTVGRYYVATGMTLEMTPLLLLEPVLFLNTGDGSGMLQLIFGWSIYQDLDLRAGFNLPNGADGTEFGGLFVDNDMNELLGPPDTLFARLAWYF